MRMNDVLLYGVSHLHMSNSLDDDNDFSSLDEKTWRFSWTSSTIYTRMQIRVVLVSVAAAVLRVVVAVLGIVAERANSNSFVGFDVGYCLYRSTVALGRGGAATVFLLGGQAVITQASGCFGRCGGGEARARASYHKRSVVARMSAISWALTGAAAGMFMYGAWRNAAPGRGPTLYGCAVLRGGVFSTASASSAIAFALGIPAYVYQETAGPEEPRQVAGPPVPGIEMVQLHFPPQPVYPPAICYYQGPVVAPPPYGGYGAKASASTA